MFDVLIKIQPRLQKHIQNELGSKTNLGQSATNLVASSIGTFTDVKDVDWISFNNGTLTFLPTGVNVVVNDLV